MRIVILHYHLRPGGVRRIIELATPHLIRKLGRVEAIIVATGEKPDSKWQNLFCCQVEPVPVEFVVAPSFGYLSEQTVAPSITKKRIRAALKSLLTSRPPHERLIWAHNLGVGRNLLLTHELNRICARRRIPLALHHHDWWFDNRWLRWPEMSRAGFCSLNAVARSIFSIARSTHHLTINRSDALQLRRHFPQTSHWLPNLVERPAPPPAARIHRAKNWLGSLIGDRTAAIWILPCRGLRRKNFAEALLLMRWLRPTAWLVTTGGASSATEKPYFNQLAAAAIKNRWPLRLGILQGDETQKPSVAELLAASEVVLLTSIQEGFGLPFLEAAAARRPLVARAIPNISPDLAKFGFRFPQSYDEVLIDPALFNWRQERLRQEKLFRSWRDNLPKPVQQFVEAPALLAGNAKPRPLPFSRLTFTAQLEVLAQPIELSWRLCAPLNHFLVPWKKRAQTGRLQLTRWPRTADQWLSGAAYARRFVSIMSHFPEISTWRDPAPAAQADFLRAKLAPQQLFPLLWATQT